MIKVIKKAIIVMVLMAVSLPMTFGQVPNMNDNNSNPALDLTTFDIYTTFPEDAYLNFYTADAKIYWYNAAGCIAQYYDTDLLVYFTIIYHSSVPSFLVPTKIWYEIRLKDDKGKTRYCVGGMYNIPYPSPFFEQHKIWINSSSWSTQCSEVAYPWEATTTE